MKVSKSIAVSHVCSTPTVVATGLPERDTFTVAKKSNASAPAASRLPHPETRRPGQSQQAAASGWSNVAKGVMMGALLLSGAAAQTPAPPRKPTPGSIGTCSPFASYHFEQDFDIVLTACCKQVNPARDLIKKIEKCGTFSRIAENPAGLFMGGIGKPSDCPDSNTDNVYTTGVFTDVVQRNSTAFQCIANLIRNPVIT